MDDLTGLDDDALRARLHRAAREVHVLTGDARVQAYADADAVLDEVLRRGHELGNQ